MLTAGSSLAAVETNSITTRATHGVDDEAIKSQLQFTLSSSLHLSGPIPFDQFLNKTKQNHGSDHAASSGHAAGLFLINLLVLQSLFACIHKVQSIH